MATFLELVNDVARESGTISESQELTTVTGATGRLRKIVAWTRQAWEIIQRSRNDWTFTREGFTAALSVGQTSYDPVADLGLTGFGRWLAYTDSLAIPSIYDPAIGAGDETRLHAISFRDFMHRFNIGVQTNIRPDCYAIGGRTLHIGGPPDKAYAIRGFYRRGVQSLATDAEEPFVDEQYHQAIVWRALMLLGDDDEAPFEVASSTAQFEQIYRAMVRDYTDMIELA